jgi:hypothetical protein
MKLNRIHEARLKKMPPKNERHNKIIYANIK